MENMGNPEDRNWTRILLRIVVVGGVCYVLLFVGIKSCTDAAAYCTRTTNKQACLPVYCPAVYQANVAVQVVTGGFVKDATLGYSKMEHSSNLCNYFVCDEDQLKHMKQ